MITAVSLTLTTMKFIVVDIQGFCIPEFTPKELVLYDGYQTNYYLFRPSCSFSCLPDDVMKQVKFLQGTHHCIPYNSGHVALDDIPDIFRTHIIDEGVDRVYIKGQLKRTYLEQFLPTDITIINLEDVWDCPKLKRGVPLCMNHLIKVYNKSCICSLNNAILLYDFVINKLPI